MRRIFTAMLVAALAIPALAQTISLPPSGDNQESSVSQNIGLVNVSIRYNSPNVHAPDGTDRRGKIWGALVPYGLTNLGFGTCKECPWRMGANENTVFTVSHDVKIEGQPLPAGSYALFAIPDPNEWTLIFSKNSSSWGSFYYDAAEDALRVKVKPRKNEYTEWLTYDFIDRDTDHATVAMKWEELAVPFTIKVDNAADLYLAQIKRELRDAYGFQWQNWDLAANYALQNKRLDDALQFADTAVHRQFIGNENYRTLTTLANVEEAAGKLSDAKATREKALNHPTATPADLHQYARQLLAKGNKEEALRVWELNAKRNGTAWPTNVGLARGYSAAGRYKDALKYAKAALAQAPDEVNRKNLEEAVKKLSEGKDMN